MISARSILATALVLALAACASSPVRFYTMVAPSDGPLSAADAGGGKPLSFDLAPIRIPAQVDQPQLVVREGGQRLAVLESDRWIAPLADEVHAALAGDLVRALPGPDLTGVAGATPAVLHIRVDLRRFDSVPGASATIEAAWSLRAGTAASPSVLVCTTTISEPVGPGYDALVQGHQRVIGRLAEEIAAAARGLIGGGVPACR
jgi:uncharacterized lipoprotein YmbA